ncbi:MAG: TOBE domain-containing protein [Flavobacteriaceae bacterium]
MNRLEGEIIGIVEDNGLSQVTISLGADTKLKCLVIDTPTSASYLRIGIKRAVVFKETEVILAKGKENTTSLQNKIRGTILNIKEGKLLCEVSVKTEAGLVISIIPAESKYDMELKIGEPVSVMIKQNEIMLSE